MKPPVADCLLLSCSKEENMLAAPFRSCWRLCSSFSVCPFSVQHLALLCYQHVEPGSNCYTKNMCHSGHRDTSGSNCAGVSCEDRQKDDSALVTTARIVPRHDKEILPQKANAACRCIWNVLLDKRAVPQVADQGRMSHRNYF